MRVVDAREERAGAATGAAAPLGNNADFVSPTPFLPPPSTVRAWYLRSQGRQLLKSAGIDKRLRWCGYRISRNENGVGVYSRPDRVYGRVSGVCVCGQSICCPVCAPRIAAFRSAEVATGFERAKALGYEARLTTFTFPHKAGNNLGDEIDVFASAWRKFVTGKMGMVRRKGSLGNIVGREVTYGKAGYHYHYHALRYDLPGTFVEDLHRAGWLSALDSIGRRTAGTQERAFHVGEVGDRAQAAYCAKLSTAVEAQARAIGSEVASAATKGRNLASLLADAAQGDALAARVWVEGVSEIVKRKVSSVRWSRGLRAVLGCEVEKDDETVAAEEVVETDVYLGQLTPHQWRGVLTHRAEFALCVAANNGLDAVNSFLAGLELGELDEEKPEPVQASLELDQEISRQLYPAAILEKAKSKRDNDRPSGLSRNDLEAMKGL